MKLLLKVVSLVLIVMSNAVAAEEEKIYFDKARNRYIPVMLYHSSELNKDKPVVIISHGYEVKNTEYSFIANNLAENGYLVLSIQHDLKTDKPLPRKGNLFEIRRPLWERGAENIRHVVSESKKKEPNLNLSKIVLIGHSNGGDISMMFTTLYPEMVSKVISLDSRRYPFPRNPDIEILRFGASDDEPDEGVVPEGVQVIYVKGARHIDLCDRGSSEIKHEIQKSINQFLDR